MCVCVVGGGGDFSHAEGGGGGRTSFGVVLTIPEGEGGGGVVQKFQTMFYNIHIKIGIKTFVNPTSWSEIHSNCIG